MLSVQSHNRESAQAWVHEFDELTRYLQDDNHTVGKKNSNKGARDVNRCAASSLGTGRSPECSAVELGLEGATLGYQQSKQTHGSFKSECTET
jgi:hypothetical protein